MVRIWPVCHNRNQLGFWNCPNGQEYYDITQEEFDELMLLKTNAHNAQIEFETRLLEVYDKRAIES